MLGTKLSPVLLALPLIVSAAFASQAQPVTCSVLGTDDAARPGNICSAVEPLRVRVTVPAGATSVVVTATDYWNAAAAEGKGDVADGAAVVTLDIKRPGYYLLKAQAKKGGDVAATSYSACAIVAPVKVADEVASPFGAMTHFAQAMSPSIIPLLKHAGICSVRDEQYWDHVEKKKGVYEFGSKFTGYMALLKEAGINPLVPMTFENKLHDGGLTPYSAEGCDAYGRYGQAILKQYGEQVKWLEIWNEYNGSWCKGPADKDRPKFYTQMLKAAYERIKEVRPDVKVAGCACVLIPLLYLEGIFKAGGLQYMDAVVIHPYRGTPEGVDDEVAELKELIRKYNDGKDKPIWVTETGSMDKAEDDWEKGKGFHELGRRNIARYLVRQYTLLLSQGVERILWYLSADHMEFVSMGLLRGPKDPMGKHTVAPAYVAYATLIRQLDSAKFSKRECERKYTRVRAYLFNRGAESIRVCWATKPAQIEIKAAAPLTLVDIMGGEKTLQPDAGKVVVRLDETPVYIKGAIESLTETGITETVVADSVDDYSKEQGRNGWSYGCFDGMGQGSGDGAEPSGPYTDDDFKPFAQVQTMWGYEWTGKAPYNNLTQRGAHPGNANKKAVWAVRRWKSSFAGAVRISGAAQHDKQGDGVGLKILVDGKEVFTQLVGGPKNPERAEFDVPATLKVGSLVDFAITPGPGTDTSYDGTTFGATISTK